MLRRTNEHHPLHGKLQDRQTLLPLLQRVVGRSEFARRPFGKTLANRWARSVSVQSNSVIHSANAKLRGRRTASGDSKYDGRQSGEPAAIWHWSRPQRLRTRTNPATGLPRRGGSGGWPRLSSFLEHSCPLDRN